MSDKQCPIPGCNFRFHRSATGWAKHVMTEGNHPTWWKKGQTGEEARLRFKAEYPDWFRGVEEPRVKHESGTVRTGLHEVRAESTKRELFRRMSTLIDALRQLQESVARLPERDLERLPPAVAKRSGESK